MEPAQLVASGTGVSDSFAPDATMGTWWPRTAKTVELDVMVGGMNRLLDRSYQQRRGNWTQ